MDIDHGRPVRTCRACGCTDDDCRGCIERTGQPCAWADEDLCTACATTVFWAGVTAHEQGVHRHHNPYRQHPETEPYASDWDKGWNYAAARWSAQVDEMDLGGLDERL